MLLCTVTPLQTHLEDLAKSRLSTLPIIALVVSEDKIVAIQVMYNAVDATVSRNCLHPLRLLNVFGGHLVSSRLSLEKSDAEPARLENADDMLDDVSRLSTSLAGRYIGLERGVGALGLRCDVYSEVVGGIRTFLGAVGSTTWGGNDAVGREATGREQVGVDAGVGVLGGRVNIGQTTVLRNNRAEGMALSGQLLRESKLLVRVETRVVGRSLLEHVEAVVRGMGVSSGIEDSGAAEALAVAILFRNGT